MSAVASKEIKKDNIKTAPAIRPVPANSRESKKDIKTIQRPKLAFPFNTINYILLLSGLVLMVIGYIVLSGGGSNDPNKFNPELFSTSRMVIAPLILLLGFLVAAFSIFYHPEDKTEGKPENKV